MSVFSKILGFGSKSGPANPYAPADFSRLLDFSDLDFLKTPTATDELTKKIYGDLMKSLTEGVDVDVSQAAGSLKSDFFDRGLSGPGMISDIESGALGDLYTKGAKAKGDIRSQFALAELGTEREKQKQLADLITQRMIAAITGQGNAYSQAAQTQVAGQQPGFLENILRNPGSLFQFQKKL